MIFVSLVNDPLYKLILSGQSSAEHFDFEKSIFLFFLKKLKSSVSYGMAGASGICIFVVIYLFFDTKKFIKKKEKEMNNMKTMIIEPRNHAQVGANNQNEVEFIRI